MKRYRVLSFDFDTRATMLGMEINEDWDKEIKKQHILNKNAIQDNLIKEYGQYDFERKIKDFIDLGSKPFSIIAFHNKFLDQLRTSFVVGSYYPSLTAACALGERILNHLLLHLREDFRHTPEYKTVYNKNSFDNWNIPIQTMETWNVLLPETVNNFKKLYQIRNRTIHFNPETDHNDRSLALEAIGLLNTIIQTQFGAFGTHPWFIPNIPGASFIKKEAEQNIFIQKIYLPNCYLVGPKHRLEFTENGLVIHDHEYEDHDITDDEFRALIM